MKWIFLPGLDGSGEFFEPFLKVLPREVEPVTIAFPQTERMGYEELLRWLLPRLPAGEPFLVVAESFSGPLAVRLAGESPAGMVGAVISASFVRYPLPRLLSRLPFETIFRLRFPKPLVRFVFADQSASPELYDLFYRAVGYSPPPVIAHRARAALRVDESEALRKCRLPLLFLEATADRLVQRRSMKLVRRIRPDLPVLQIAAPHFLLQLKSEDCLRVIQGYEPFRGSL